MNIKDYLAKQLLNETFRFKCNCLVSFDIIGKVVDYEIVNNEIVFIINSDNKIIKIGENHPNLEIYII
jgi:hypothetical protein